MFLRNPILVRILNIVITKDEIYCWEKRAILFDTSSTNLKRIVWNRMV